VCKVLDVARLDSGAPYIVMELMQGVDLARTIAQRPLPATIAVEYIMQASVAVAEAHAAGIVHRDLKPANLFVTRRPDGGPLVKVLDFGIAKALSESDQRLTLTRAVLGSPGYMSPEQFESPRDVDARADIWALGVTLYQLLSGRLPFWGRNQTETAVKIATDPPPPLDVDPRLRAVVFRCLEKAREDRYQDVAALAADLVPFGGPRARRISATLSRVASRAITAATPAVMPVALPAARTAATAVTMASLMTEAPRIANARSLAAGSRSMPRMAVWKIAAAAVVVIAVAVGVAFLLRSLTGRGDAVAASPGSPGSAAPAAPTAAAAPAPAPAKVAVPTEAKPASPPAPAAPDPAHDGKATPDTRGSEAHRAGDTTSSSDGLAAQMRQACEVVTQQTKASAVAPRVLVACWCQLHDQAHARQAFARIMSATDREAARGACAKQGIELQ
jgi:serine/threonine-protein kinase